MTPEKTSLPVGVASRQRLGSSDSQSHTVFKFCNPVQVLEVLLAPDQHVVEEHPQMLGDFLSQEEIFHRVIKL